MDIKTALRLVYTEAVITMPVYRSYSAAVDDGELLVRPGYTATEWVDSWLLRNELASAGEKKLRMQFSTVWPLARYTRWPVERTRIT